MKKTVIALIFSVILTGIAKAQVPGEAFPLVNSLNDLWSSGKTEAAIDASIRLYTIYPPLLIEIIHTSLSQSVKQDSFYYNANDYLEALIKKNNQGITRIVKPLYLWSKTIHDSDRVQLNRTFNEMAQVLGDSSDYESKAESYALLMLNEPTVQKLIDKDSRDILLHKIVRNLETYPNLDLQVKGRKELEERAWSRYLLAYSSYMRYTLFDRKEEYLIKASKYSPDEQDVQVKYAYFYDAFLLTGNVKQIGFQKEYLNYLTENHRTREVLAILSEITFNSPSDENLKTLKDMCVLENSQVSFKEYWHQYINQKGKKVPSLKIEFAEGTLDLTKNRDYWVYIDVWGTWCSPCVKELPTLQEFFMKNNQRSNPVLKIYTFSFSSPNRVTFMKDKHFTFPVFEIDKKINDDFEVSGYPTKILISPTGNYVKIPFNVDWRMYIKNYCLLE
jgi:thiol-disulfide isomerase/thioredoxin